MNTCHENQFSERVYDCELPAKFGTADRCSDLLKLCLKGRRWEAPALASLATEEVFKGGRVQLKCKDSVVAEVEYSVVYVTAP